jgi:hypothetical protein
MNAGNCLILAAVITPKAVSVNDSNSSSPIRIAISSGLYGTWANRRERGK